MGYSFIASRYFPKSPSPIIQQTVELQQKEQPKTEKEITINEEANLPTVSIDNFHITYSSRGGYIKKISSKTYGEDLIFKNIGLIQQDDSKEFTPSLQSDRIIFTSPKGDRKEFIFQKDIIRIKLFYAAESMVLFSNSLSNNALDQGYQETFSFYNDDLQRKTFKNIKDKAEIAFKNVQFAGIRDKYFCISLLKGTYNIIWKKNKNDVYLISVSPASETSLYLGPQIENQLKPYGLQGIINYGFFHAIGAGLSWLLHFFYSLSKSWGASIVLFAVFVYALLFPFTAKSTKAMKRMAEIQPEVEELRKKYKDNPQKLNKETLELYKKYKINPLGGCLPMLLQFPVFIALYQVLLRFVELKGVSFLWIKDLSLPDHAFKLPFPPPVDYINILPIFIAILGLLQQKLVTASSAPSEQKTMGLFFSVFMGVIFYGFPASLTLYWSIQNLLSFAYQMRVGRARVSGGVLNHP